jgi:hypothetical protein
MVTSLGGALTTSAIKTKDDNQTVLSGNLELNHEHSQRKNER